MTIAEKVNVVKESIPASVKLVVVSKTKPTELIMEVYETGHRVFGENRVQEIMQKYEDLPKDIEWHLVGHLQSNKVKFVAPFIHTIHSVDSLKLLKTIDKEALGYNRTINCLLEMHIAQEETKFGFSLYEIEQMLHSEEFKNLKNVNVVGLMGMATYTVKDDVVRNEFHFLAHCFKELKQKYFAHNEDFKEISMGMSGDYKIAIEAGSTMVRIGSAIFG